MQTKSCSVCKVAKPLRDFQRKASAHSGYGSACRKCDSARRIRQKVEKGLRRPDSPPGYKWCSTCDTEKPLGEFYNRLSGPHKGRPHAHCKPCIKADNIRRARVRGVPPRNEAHPDYTWRRRLLIKYKMIPDDYERMLNAQNRACPGCGVLADGSAARFSVDHDHACCPGETTCGACIRGLLCRLCNFTVGHAGDDPQVLVRLATYLDAYASSQPSGS